MKNNKIIYKNNIQKKYLSPKLNQKLNNKYFNILKNIIFNLDNKENTLYSLSKKFNFNFKFKNLNKFKKFKTVVIIGMGGSILGSEALYYILKEKIKKDFIFFDDIDKNKLKKLKQKNDFKKILFIVISKSGRTIETLSNSFALKIIKKDAKNIIIISEKKDNSLYLLSQKMRIHHIEHRKSIGGRYSVLSEVAAVPAYLMGVNILKFRKNLQHHYKSQKNKFLKESSIKLANLLKKNKFKNLIFFNYIPEFDMFLYWLQQLIAESLGKNGKGFLPTVCKAPKDHHSLLQLYLDGPKDKIFYIFSEKIKNDKKEKIKTKNLDKSVSFFNNKSLNQIKNAQKNAFIRNLRKKEIPFREFQIKDFSEDAIGELFSYFMLEVTTIGKLADINPFNQPAVEQVKIDTKKILV